MGAFPSAFASPEWVLSWWRHYGRGQEPWCLAIEGADGALEGLAPFAMRRTWRGRTLLLAGGRWNGLESVPCTRGSDARFADLIVAALEQRRSEWDTLLIQRLPSDTPLASRLFEASTDLRASARDLRSQPFLELPRSVEEFEARFRAKQRNTFRRKRRRLAALGAEIRLISDQHELEASILRLLLLRRSRAESRSQRHRHLDAAFECFLLEAVRELMPDRARLWTLELDGSPLAMRLNLVAGPREHSFLLGLADEHQDLSPGSVLEHHAIHSAIEEGRSEIDLGPGRHEYKYRLGATDRALTRMLVPSGSLSGAVAGSLAKVDLALRKTAAAEMLRRRLGHAPGHDSRIRFAQSHRDGRDAGGEPGRARLGRRDTFSEVLHGGLGR